MTNLSRRIVGAFVLIAGLLIASACAPAAQPTQVAAPTQPPTAPTTAPAAAAPVADKPAATQAPKPTAQPAWQAEWDKVVAAAKKEGKVVAGGARGEGYRNAVVEFTKVYPEISLEYTPMAGRDVAPRILAERQGGLYLWDVYMGGTGTIHETLIPNGVIAPLRPALILPEVLDDSKWRQGFDDGWTDRGEKYVYAFLGYVTFSALVNRDVAPASELKTLDDLLDPKWKGKIVWQDPRTNGSGSQSGANMMAEKGEDWYRKLLSNDIVPLLDSRMALEGLARGKYVVIIGYRQDEENQLREAGLLGNVEVLDPDSSAGGQLLAGSGNVTLVDKAPHPNAAKVFINWLLSRDGQEVYVKHTNLHSRRLDVRVQGDPTQAPRPGVKYNNFQKEKGVEIYERALEVAKEVVK